MQDGWHSREYDDNSSQSKSILIGPGVNMKTQKSDTDKVAFEPISIFTGTRLAVPMTSPTIIKTTDTGIALNGLLRDTEGTTEGNTINIIGAGEFQHGIPVHYAIGFESDKAHIVVNDVSSGIRLDIVDRANNGNFELRDDNNNLAYLMTDIEYTLHNKTFYQIRIEINNTEARTLQPFESSK